MYPILSHIGRGDRRAGILDYYKPTACRLPKPPGQGCGKEALFFLLAIQFFYILLMTRQLLRFSLTTLWFTGC